MCGLFSAELESQSGSERVEARSDQTPELRLFDSACFPDYPSSDLSQALLIEVTHRMDHHPKESGATKSLVIERNRCFPWPHWLQLPLFDLAQKWPQQEAALLGLPAQLPASGQGTSFMSPTLFQVLHLGSASR